MKGVPSSSPRNSPENLKGLSCLVCSHRNLKNLFVFDCQPVSNRFLFSPGEKEELFSFQIAMCKTCGLMQIPNPISFRKLKPRFDWISYREPDSHLAKIASSIEELPGIFRNSHVIGISQFDDPLLNHLRNRGFVNVNRWDSRTDLDIEDENSKIETIQDQVSQGKSCGFLKWRGKADLVVGRYILEHAHSPRDFVSSLKSLLKPGGYLVFEVPDCSLPFQSFDYSMIWEEHTLYFTPGTFQQSLSIFGLSNIQILQLQIGSNSCLTGIGRLTENLHPDPISSPFLEGESSPAEIFARMFPEKKHALHRFLKNIKRERGKIAVLGAGHCACTWINLLEVGPLIDFVVDDDPKKQRGFLPGSKLPIMKSISLVESGAQVCLSSVVPENEEKLLVKNHLFLENGGTFWSIFPHSNRALPCLTYFSKEKINHERN